MDRQDFNHDEMEGIDADIETSLKEYGIAWIKGDTETLFYYGAIEEEIDGNLEYTTFDFCTFDNDMGIKKEFNWIDSDGWKRFFRYVGIDNYGHQFETWIDQGLPICIYDLIQYYGPDNIFGPSYWQGLTYDEIFI